MKTLIQSVVAVTATVMLLAGLVMAQPHYAVLTVEVPIDASLSSDLIVTPDTLVVEALRPGDQAGYDVTVENRGTEICKEVFPTQRSMSPYLALQTWPIEQLAPMESAEIRVIITVSENIPPDITMLSMELGLICVR
ncbi:hypothetical protein LCGC14_1330170 [marine sediment metagenome]|uniref:DUF11 domain-containing protein n=1 Tax=marine sediment metagenome TaxID=412755 RepID=A0A0F9KHJ6_9ZZZZ